MKLKISWKEFVEAALRELRREFPNIGLPPEFIESHGYDAPGAVGILPDWVEIEIVRNEK